MCQVVTRRKLKIFSCILLVYGLRKVFLMGSMDGPKTFFTGRLSVKENWIHDDPSAGSNSLGKAKPDTYGTNNTNRNAKPYFENRNWVKDVDCRAIVNRNETEIQRAEELTRATEKIKVGPKDYILMTRNCSDFIKYRGYITDALTTEEKGFPIAYSILMYKDVEQAERLLRAIYRPQNMYCIHVDLKSETEVFDAMENISKCFENVFLTGKRFNVTWGTMTILQPELLCMEELWKKSKLWKYFINLTGQEFPLRTNYEIVKILKVYDGANDVSATTRTSHIDRWKNAGEPPHRIVPVKGSVFIVASRGYVDFILHDSRAMDFLHWVSNTTIPDETFFASLNHNPSLGVPGSYLGNLTITPNGTRKAYVARFVNWKDNHNKPACRGKEVRSVCVFGVGDLPVLASRKELFANKFYLDYSHYGLDCLEELIYNRTRDEYLGYVDFDSNWYSELDFVINKVK